MSLEIAKQDTKAIEIEDKEAPPENLSFCANLLNYVREWTSRSSLHGIYYVFEANRSICERIYWILVIALAAVVCFASICDVLEDFDDSSYPIKAFGPIKISDIPFPAVTICPQIKSRLEEYNLRDYYIKLSKDPKSLNSEDLKMFENMSLVCKDDFNNIPNVSDYLQNVEFLRTIALDKKDIFEKCVWNRKEKPCNDLFLPTYTDEGVCFTFNMMSLTDIFKTNMASGTMFTTPDKVRKVWTLVDGYVKFDKKDTFPMRPASAGLKNGITLYLRAATKNMGQVCKNEMQGFKIQLHSPGEYPNFEREYFRAPLNKEIIVGVEPNKMASDVELFDYYPDEIGCSFPNEKIKELNFYRQYTQNHCELECLAKHVKNRCNCVEYYMPRDDDTKICGIGKKTCVNAAFSSNKCKCLPGCFSLTYNTDISQYDYQQNDAAENILTKVTIYFKHSDFLAFKRSKSPSEFEELAKVGGLISFFLGISFLYVAEIFYFLTLRCLCNARRLGNQFWSGSEEGINLQ